MKGFFWILTAGLLVLSVSHTSATIRYVDLNSPNPTPPYTNWAMAATTLQDAVDAALEGDEIVVTNGTYATGGRAVDGTMTNRVAVYKPLAVRSVNGALVTVILGRRIPHASNGDGAVRCVYLTNGASLSGFTLANGATLSSGWSSGYTQLLAGGGVWCASAAARVADCILTGNSATWSGGGAYGGTLTNCLLTGNSAGFGGGSASNDLKSCTLTANSAADGGGAAGSTLNNCMVSGNSAGSRAGGVYLSALTNCTLTANSAEMYDGGGASYSTLSYCTLSGNSAHYDGGGAYAATLSNCILVNNSAMGGGGVARSALYNCQVSRNSGGGGASVCTLDNCTVTDNSPGGVYGGTLNNCIVYFNVSTNGSNYSQGGSGTTLNYCCTTPLPANGVGNITSDPLFVDRQAGDLRLQPNSPCINAGNNANAPGPADLDGNPRVAGGTVDIGAYEFQTPASVLSFSWLQEYGLPVDGSADFMDSDHDGLNNWQEWICGTNPTNTLSALRLLSAQGSPAGVALTWESVAGRTYFLERARNLADQPPFLLLVSNIVGKAGATTSVDTNAVGTGPFFYRVGVH